MLEIAASKMNEKTWARATGLPFSTSEQKIQAQQIIQAAQMSGQQPDPKALQVMQAPGWDKVLELLKDDVQRAYRIDIETNSTIDVESTEDQKNVGDFMNAMGQLMAGLTPMVEKGAMPFEAAQSILLAVVRRFRFGTEVEDQFKNMKAPPKGNPEAAAAQAEMAKQQAESQIAMQELQQKAQQSQAELAQKNQMDMLELQSDYKVEMAKMEAKQQIELAKIQAKSEADAAKIQAQRSVDQMKANIQRDGEMRKASLAAETQIKVARIGAKSALMCSATKESATPINSIDDEVEELDMEDEKSEASLHREQMQEMMQTNIQMQTALLAELAKPKPPIDVVTDKNGVILSLVPKAV